MQENNPDLTSTQQPVADDSLGWCSLGIHPYVKCAIVMALMYYIFHVELYGIVNRWISDSSWSHGFLIPFFSLYFLNQNKKELLQLKTRPNYLGLAALVLCCIGYYFIVFQLKFGYAKSLLIIPTAGSILLFLGGWRLLRYTWLPTFYLIFAMPLPARIYNDITIPMRRLAAAFAAQLLSLVKGLDASASGVVIDVMYKGVPLEPSLDVAEACSGMRLLMAFMALGVAMAYLHYRPIWQRLILLASTIPIAICCNIVRVTVTGFIYILWDSKYAQGIYHDMLGMLMLPLAFSLYGLLAWFMSNLMTEDKQPQDDDIIVRRQNG